MRITCPSCLAQYEIDAELLAPDGRDVQCSACNTVWFQQAPARKPTRNILPPEPDDFDPVPEPSQADPKSGTAALETDLPDEGPAPAPAMARQKSLDPAVTDILRDEARFESEARKRDAERVEVQPDLGLLGGAPWPSQTNPDQKTPQSEGIDPPKSSLNQSAFPDIEDVSATLEPLDKRRDISGGGYDLPQTAQERQRAFLRGFALPVAIGALLVGLYLAAPLLSQLVPAAAPVLDGFTGFVDTARASLAALVGLSP